MEVLWLLTLQGTPCIHVCIHSCIWIHIHICKIKTDHIVIQVSIHVCMLLKIEERCVQVCMCWHCIISYGILWNVISQPSLGGFEKFKMEFTVLRTHYFKTIMVNLARYGNSCSHREIYGYAYKCAIHMDTNTDAVPWSPNLMFWLSGLHPLLTVDRFDVCLHHVSEAGSLFYDDLFVNCGKMDHWWRVWSLWWWSCNLHQGPISCLSWVLSSWLIFFYISEWYQ